MKKGSPFRLAWFVVVALATFTATAQPQSLSISGLRQFYSSPYLLDFTFSVRDQTNHAVVVDPSQFQVVCREDVQAISQSESGYRLLSGDNKQLKCFLVLDYTRSILDPAINGDSDGDFISDSVEAMEAGAKAVIGTLHDDAQVGLFEFHRADASFPPKKIASLTVDKSYLTNQINQIYTNIVWTSGAARCWDALYLALSEFPNSNPADDQRFLVFLSNGKDESSTRTVNEVISLAQVKGAKIYCIGYGQELTPANLQNITSQTGGQYYRAASVSELPARVDQIVADLGGQYILRWTTLKRGSSSFTPSFELTYAGQKASATAGTNWPNSYGGNELQGRMMFDTSVSQSNVATLVLRATYVPRSITRLRLNFAIAKTFTVQPVPYSEGGVCPTNWVFTVNQTNGVGYCEFSSPNPANPFMALPFATLGKLVRFQLQGVTNLNRCFYGLEVDNSLYQQTGGQTFVIDNANAVLGPPVLPHGTPVAWLAQYGITNNLIWGELADQDGDGVPTWQEYLTSTNPTNRNSAFLITKIQPGNGYQITFNTESNRVYRLDYTDAFSDWQVLQAGILGNGLSKTEIDSAYRAQRFYRVAITGATNQPPANVALIPAGSFVMGDTDSGAGDEHPTHAVDLSAFYMDKYEVTKALWDEVYQWAIGHGYSFDMTGLGKTANHPVYMVNWYDAVKWCNARSEMEGRIPAYYTTAAAQTTVYRSGQVDVQNNWVNWSSGYRLATEAEWEKAARGGLSGKRFPWGDTITHSQANYRSDSFSASYDVSPTSGYHPSYDDYPEPYTSPVGSFAPNGYGLYDMTGNMFEWCWDWHNSAYYSSSPKDNPRGSAAGSARVARGGGWNYNGSYCRSAGRYYGGPAYQSGIFGFRSVLPMGQ